MGPVGVKNLVLWVVWIMTIQGVRVRSRLKITPKEAGVVIIVVPSLVQMMIRAWYWGKGLSYIAGDSV